jgi:hypothetical protein
MLEALGNLGDFLGGLGVVITLIYLARQIRQNTKSVESAAFQAATRDIADAIADLSRDPELSRIAFDGMRDFESFSREDRRRFSTYMAGLLRRYENLLEQTRLGNIEPESYQGVRDELTRIFALPGTQAWWSRGHVAFNQALRDQIDHEISVAKGGAPAAQQATVIEVDC